MGRLTPILRRSFFLTVALFTTVARLSQPYKFCGQKTQGLCGFAAATVAIFLEKPMTVAPSQIGGLRQCDTPPL